MKIDFMKVFGLLEKGLGAIHTAVEQEKNVGPSIIALKNLAASAKGGKVTVEQITSTEATLDALIEDFNTPLE